MDPRHLPPNLQADPQFLHWVKSEAQRLRDEGEGGLVQQQARMLRFWEEYRPQMWARLQQAGPNVAKDLAVVLDHLAAGSAWQYLQAGLPPSDAREQANLEWLLMEPEEPGEGSEPAETSPTPDDSPLSETTSLPPLKP